MEKEIKVERKSRIVLGLMSILLLLVFIAFSLGSAKWMTIIMIISGIMISILLYSESAIISYVKTKQYKKISYGDFVVFATVLIATGVLFNSIFQIPLINSRIPESLLSFTKSTAVITGIIGIVLSLLHIFTKKFQ